MTPAFSSCSRCGFEPAPGTRFCPNCGGAIVAPPMVAQPMTATAAAASAPAGTAVPPPPFQTATALCAQCGNEFASGTRFCPNCGTMAGAAAPPRPSPVPPQPMPAPPVCSRCGSPLAAGTRFCSRCGNSMALGIPTAQSVYGGFGIRLLADLIDTLVLLVTFAILELVPVLNFFVPVTIFMSVLATAFYGAITESSVHQASLGKRAMGLKVTDEEGKRISFGRGLVRWGVKEFPIFGALGCITVAFTLKKQGVHDLIAGTLVWRTN